MDQQEINQNLQAAVAIHNQGELDGAERIYREILSADPDNFYALNFCGCICREKGNFDEGIDLLSRAVILQPRNTDAVYNLGNAFNDAERWEEAISCYEKALSFKPENPKALNNLGISLQSIEHYEQAEIVLRRAVSLQPDFDVAWFNLGNTLKEQKQYSEAIKCYEKAIKLKPNFAECYYQSYAANKILGDHGSALIALKACLKANPNHYNAKQSIGFAFSRADQSEEAIQYFSSKTENFDFIYWVHLFRALEGRISEKLLNGVDLKNKFIEEILSRIGATEIAAFGDSHVNAFRNINGVFVNYLGACTAYNLSNKNSSSGGGKRLNEKLELLTPKSSAILLCFGEIDCRAHIVKQAYIQNRTIQQVATAAAKSYINLILSIKQKGFNVIVYGPYGSGSQFNSFGAEVYRNTAVKYFNKYLQESCLAHNVYFFSLNNLLVDPSSLLTRRTYLEDDVHLPDHSHSSDQVKALLLSQLLANIQLQQERLNPSSLDLNLEKSITNIHGYGISKENKSSYVYVRISDSGLIEWPPELDESIESICFDLGASLALKTTFLSFRTRDQYSTPLELKIDGVKLEVTQEMNLSRPTVQINFPKDCIGRFIMISGFNKLSDFYAISFAPITLQLE